MNPVAIVQARMGSTRLPGKVLMDVAGEPLLWRVVERLRRAPSLREIVVATSTQPADAAVVELCRERGIPCVAGSESDVLDRYREAALRFDADPVIRATGDCPLIDPAPVERVLETYRGGGYDYVALAAGGPGAQSGCGRFPSGFDNECFSFAALETAWRESTVQSDREHVTPFMYRTDRFRVGRVAAPADLGHFRCSVDNPEDLELVRRVYAELGSDGDFGLPEILSLFERRPELPALNAHYVGREGHAQLLEAA
jgi:spore coat polysaccharide biosynthesis protein SpsF (cytidylyltransferase family)